MYPDAPMTWHSIPNAPFAGAVLGLVADIADGGVRVMMLEPQTGSVNLAPFRLILLRSGNSVFAYVNRCAHFGIPLSENDEHLKFVPHVSISCNVHYARYRWQDGVCVWGDCEDEGLIAIPITIDAAGEIRIARA